MSVITINDIAPDVKLGIWKISESIDDFLDRYPHLVEEINIYKGVSRKLERLAIYSLVYEITGNTNIIISHNSDGKPLIDGWRISISHTKGYAAVIMSKYKNVAIDIEYNSDRVENVSSKYIRPDENVSSTHDKLLLWCAKETVYKYFSSQDLSFYDMRMLPNEIDNENSIYIEIIKIGCKLPIFYYHTKDYMLTYCYHS